MVAAIFVVLTTTSGLGFYNASVILRVAKDELGTSVTAVSGATALWRKLRGRSGLHPGIGQTLMSSLLISVRTLPLSVDSGCRKLNVW